VTYARAQVPKMSDCRQDRPNLDTSSNIATNCRRESMAEWFPEEEHLSPMIHGYEHLGIPRVLRSAAVFELSTY
jgi:hypothetical protein